jgi:hypothetical protein
MSLSTVSLPDFVKLGEVIWEKGRDEFVPEMRRSGIVKEVRVPMNSGNTREFSEIDLEQYASVKAEGDQAAMVQNQQGYSKVGTLYRVSFAETITYEMRTQGKYPEVTAKLTNLLPTVMARMELDLQHRVTFATATSYTDKDGRTIDTTLGDTKALSATDHTVRASSSTFRNRLANNPQLSRGSLEAMEKMRVENSINQFGQKIPCSDDILWTTDDPNTINTARELLQATASLESGSNSGVPNVYRGKYRHVKLSRVATDKDGNVDSTKAKYWGLASSRYSSFYLGVHEEPHVIVPSAKDDALTDDWVMRSAGGWMITIVSAGFFALSTGDGTS